MSPMILEKKPIILHSFVFVSPWDILMGRVLNLYLASNTYMFPKIIEEYDVESVRIIMQV